MTELKPEWQNWRFDQMAINVNERIDDPSKAKVKHYVGLEHLDSNSLKIRRWGSPSDVEATKLIFRKGDIIFGRRRVYQRKVAVAEFDGICSAHALVLRARPEVVNPDFLPFFMQSDLFMERAKAISVGSLSPTINWKTLAKEEFYLPSLEEQKLIVKLLRKGNAMVDSYQEALAQMEVLYDSFLQEMFTQHCLNNHLIAIDNLCREVTVGIVVNPSKYYAEIGVPGIRHSNVMKGEIDLSDVVYINPDEHKKLKKTQLSLGDVVLPRVSTLAGKPYYAAVIPEELDGVNSIGVVILRPDRNKVVPEFLEACLNAPPIARRLIGVAVGSIQRQLNVGIIKEETIPCPDLSTQSEIGQKSILMKKSIRSLQSRVQQAENVLSELYRKVF